jgi:acetyltransferase-like isoleucine patch superfamily enzyme
VYIFDGIKIEDNVFIGPNVSFTNDKHPKSTMHLKEHPKTLICKGVSIGAGSVILPGIKIGENSIIGAGSIVTKDVPPNSLVYGTASSIRN